MKRSHLRQITPFVCLILLLTLLLTSCWDYRDIEEYDLNVGAGLDIKDETSFDPEKPQFILSYQRTIPKEMVAGGKGGSEQKPYRNIFVTGESIYETANKKLIRQDRPRLGEHMKLIVLGEKMARAGNLLQLLDNVFRSRTIRKSTIMLITKGRAIDVFEVKGIPELPAFHLIELASNQEKEIGLIPVMTLGRMLNNFLSSSSFLMQSVVVKEGKVKFEGGAVIGGKEKKLLGFINDAEVEGITWLMGKKKGSIVISLDPKQKRMVVFQVAEMKSEIQPHVQGNNISFAVNIEAEGDIKEDWRYPNRNFDNPFIKEAEKAIQMKVKQLVGLALTAMQQEHKADLAGFGERLRIEYPRVWQKVKKNWDERFSETDVKYSVKLKIKKYEMIGEKKESSS